ncbi:MAG TPA: transporter, partial [Bacteroidia bacterium]|nr:transporter [Bacteroidia bacterium]
MLRSLLPALAILLSLSNTSAQLLTLDSCQLLAKQHYPLVRQTELLAKSKEYTLENLNKGYWPQINIGGQATYQSDVTGIP